MDKANNIVEGQDVDANQNITLPLHSLGTLPLLKVIEEGTMGDKVSIVAATPKPLFFTGNHFAYHWNYITRERFSGDTLDECLSKAENWANYLIDFQEECCYSVNGPVIEH